MKTGSPTSIRDCLLKLSQNEGLVFQQVITRYLHERLLYRLSLSKYRFKFILKGVVQGILEQLHPIYNDLIHPQNAKNH